MKLRGIPVIMYHGVGPDRPGWSQNYLLTPLEIFEGQMKVLVEEGWTTISLSDLHSHMTEGAALPEKPIVLTFDDGYLDNWVYAFPVLKRYGHRAVIWVSTDFVDPGTEVRPTLDDVWAGRMTNSELTVMGYLSWEEMRRMVGSGHVEIQSHAKTHTWYFSGPEIVDFHRPPGIDGYTVPLWLVWNMFPERKCEYISAKLEENIPYGTPIYRYGKSLVTRRYFEDVNLTELLTKRVAEGGGRAFFERRDWREELLTIVEENPPSNHRTETEEEYEERVRGELAESRRDIEDALGTSVDFICWPGGGRSPRTLEIAGEMGYRATTTHFGDKKRRNTYGQNPSEINRIGSGSPWSWRGKVFRPENPGFFLANINSFAGDKKSIWTMRLYKLRYLFRYFVFGECYHTFEG